MAGGGTREKAPSVGAALPPQGYAGAGQGGTGFAACQKHGEGGSPDPTASSPDLTASSQNLEPSLQRWVE